MNRKMYMGATCVVVMLSTNCSKRSSSSTSPDSNSPPVVVAAPRTALSHAPIAPDVSSTHPAGTVAELSPLVAMRPDEIKPHRLQLFLDDEMHIHDLPIYRTYVSDDGSTAIVLVDSEEGDWPHRLLVRPLDAPDKAIDLPLLNELCPGEVGSKCRRPETDKQVAIANKLLAKHKWVRFAHGFLGEHPTMQALEKPGCGGESLDRHSRIPGFDIEYKIVDAWTGVHLRIVRDDGAVITDSDFQPHALDESDECRLGTMPYINNLGFDLERRAMYVTLIACGTEGCPNATRILFFRLPPPLAKAADDTPPAPKR